MKKMYVERDIEGRIILERVDIDKSTRERVTVYDGETIDMQILSDVTKNKDTKTVRYYADGKVARQLFTNNVTGEVSTIEFSYTENSVIKKFDDGSIMEHIQEYDEHDNLVRDLYKENGHVTGYRYEHRYDNKGRYLRTVSIKLPEYIRVVSDFNNFKRRAVENDIFYIPKYMHRPYHNEKRNSLGRLVKSEYEIGNAKYTRLFEYFKEGQIKSETLILK